MINYDEFEFNSVVDNLNKMIDDLLERVKKIIDEFKEKAKINEHNVFMIGQLLEDLSDKMEFLSKQKDKMFYKWKDLKNQLDNFEKKRQSNCEGNYIDNIINSYFDSENGESDKEYNDLLQRCENARRKYEQMQVLYDKWKAMKSEMEHYKYKLESDENLVNNYISKEWKQFSNKLDIAKQEVSKTAYDTKSVFNSIHCLKFEGVQQKWGFNEIFGNSINVSGQFDKDSIDLFIRDICNYFVSLKRDLNSFLTLTNQIIDWDDSIRDQVNALINDFLKLVDTYFLKIFDKNIKKLKTLNAYYEDYEKIGRNIL